MTAINWPFFCFATEPCSERVLKELFQGKELVIREVDNIRNKLGRVKREQLFGHRNDLVIAFDDNAHAYDNIFDIRHDGHHSKPGKIKSNTDLMEFGNYLRFEGLTDNQKSRLYAHLQTLKGKDLEQRSCIESTCKMIHEGAGVKLKGGLPSIPSRIFKKIIENGFVDEFGKPVEYSFYRVQGKTIQETYDILKGRERDFVKRKIENIKNKITIKSVFYIVSRGVIIDVILETSGSSIEDTISP